MCAWRGISFSHGRRSAMLRLSHVLQATKSPLSSAMATTGRVGRVCEGCGLTFLRWKRLFPVLLQYARRSLKARPLTTPTRPPSRYLLFGVAGFLWERERISNEEVMRCLKQYEERVRLQGTSDPQHHYPKHNSSQNSQQTVEEHQQSSPLTSDSWSLGSLWSTVTFGWFGNTQHIPEENTSQHLKEANVVSTSMASSSEETSEEHIIDESEQKRLQFVQEMTDYLQRHSEEHISRLPVIGLSSNAPSQVSFGSKLVNRFTQLKSRVLSRVMEASELETENRENAASETDCCGSKIADLACLEMESHDHTCVSEADKVGDWFQYKILEFEQDLYSLSSDKSELSYHFYPMVGLQDHNKVANAIDQLTSLVQGSPLATVLQTIERLTHTYDHVMGTDYHLDRSLAAYSHSVKTRWNQILSGVVSEIAHELQELKGAISSNSSHCHNTSSSTNLSDSAQKRDGVCTASEGTPTCTSTENSASERTYTHVHEQAKRNDRLRDVSDRYGASELQINLFHHFDDVHLPGDEVNGPPVSRQLGQELLSMLRMVRLKVKQERQQGRVVDIESSKVNRVGREAVTTQSEGVRSEEVRSDTQTQSAAASLEGWELLAVEKSDTVYRRLYKDTGIYQYKVIGHYHDITARDYLEVQVNHEVRKEWDRYATSLDTVDSDPRSGCELIYWIMKYPFPLSGRDYVFVRKVWISPKEDAIVFISRSVDHPDYPENSKYTRVYPYFSEMVIKPHSFIDELGFDYEFTYFDNPQLRLSSTVVNWVTTAAMPDFLAKIHQAAASRRRNQMNLFHSS